MGEEAIDGRQLDHDLERRAQQGRQTGDHVASCERRRRHVVKHEDQQGPVL